MPRISDPGSDTKRLLRRLAAKLFGMQYLNNKGLFINGYLKTIFARAWVIDIPLLILIALFIPWEKLVYVEWVSVFTEVMIDLIPNIQASNKNSDFSQYAVVFLSFTHFAGTISLILPVIYAIPSAPIVEKVSRDGTKKSVKVVVCGGISVSFFIFAHLYLGAVSYLGCEECSFTYRLSLVSGAIIPWYVIHLLLATSILFFRAMKTRKT